MFNSSKTSFKIKRTAYSNHKNRAINKIGEIIIYVQIFFYSRMLYCFILDLRKRKLIQDTRFTFYVSNHLSKSFIRTERYDHHETPRWKNIYLEKWDICQIYFVFILIYTYSNYVYIKHAISIYSMTCLAIIPTLLQLAFILII